MMLCDLLVLGVVVQIKKIDSSDGSLRRIYEPTRAGYLLGTHPQKYDVLIELTPEELQQLPKVRGKEDLAAAICKKLDTSWLDHSGAIIGICLSASLTENLQVSCHHQAATLVLRVAQECFADLTK